MWGALCYVCYNLLVQVFPQPGHPYCVLDYLDCGDLVKDFWHSQLSWVVIGEQFMAVMYHKCVLYLNIGPWFYFTTLCAVVYYDSV